MVVEYTSRQNRIIMKQLILVVICHIALSANAQNVGIGITTPNASSILDVNSNSKGMLTPRMSSAQRSAITSPAKGLLVFDTDLNTFWFYNGSAWEQMIAGGSGGGLVLPYNGSITNTGPAFRVSNSGTGAAIEAASTSTSPLSYGISVRANGGVGLSAISESGMGLFASSITGTALFVNGPLRLLNLDNGLVSEGKVLTTDNNGYASWKKTAMARKVAFSAYGNIGGGADVFPAATWYKMHFSGVTYNVEGHYHLWNDPPYTSTFIVPRDGFYDLQTLITFDAPVNPAGFNSYSAVRFQFKRNSVTAALQTKVYENNYGYGDHSMDLGYYTWLKAGDEIWVEAFGRVVNAGSYIKINPSGDKNYFSIVMIHED